MAATAAASAMLARFPDPSDLDFNSKHTPADTKHRAAFAFIVIGEPIAPSNAGEPTIQPSKTKLPTTIDRYAANAHTSRMLRNARSESAPRDSSIVVVIRCRFTADWQELEQIAPRAYSFRVLRMVFLTSSSSRAWRTADRGTVYP